MEKQNRIEMRKYPNVPPHSEAPSYSGYPPHQPAYGNPPPYTENQPTYSNNQSRPEIVPQRTTVITTTPTIVMINNLGPNPTSCFCTVCNKQVVTRVEKGTSTRTHLFAAILCLFGCWLCVCIPYCTDSCKKTFHHCPECNTYMGCNS